MKVKKGQNFTVVKVSFRKLEHSIFQTIKNKLENNVDDEQLKHL